jgi:hypothetical protein
MSTTSQVSSDLDVEEPPLSRPKLVCSLGCGSIFYSKKTLDRHVRMGCLVHKRDKRLVDNRADVSGHQPPHDEPPQEGQHTVVHSSGQRVGTPQSPMDMSPAHHPPQSSPPLCNPPQSPPLSIDSQQSPTPSGGRSDGLELEQQAEGELDDYDELYLPETLQMEGSEHSETSDEGESSSDESEDEEGGGAESLTVNRPYGGSKRKTAQWYIDNKDQPLYPGCAVTVIQASYALLRAKLDHHLTDKFVDEHCKYQATALLPAGNLHPPSLHLLKKVCKVEELKKYEKHVCVNDCVKFDDVPPARYAQRAQEECPVCQSSRFVTGRGSLLVPRKVYYEVAVEEAIRSLFGDTEWSSKRSEARLLYKLDYYSTPEAHRVNRATGGALFHTDNSAYEIGIDWCQCFNFKQHSVGILGMRCVCTCML